MMNQEIFKCLEKFGFKQDCVRWIRTLYNNIESCVLNNGYSSPVFNIKRGVRQGCPLSPYLFIIGAEILGALIRQCNEIKGIQVGDKEVRLSQYADDTIIYLSATKKNLEKCCSILTQFGNISGLKINIEKSNVIRLDNVQNNNFNETNVNWVKKSFSYLGIKIPVSDELDMYHFNFDDKIKEVDNLLKVWNMRTLSLAGKITVVKSLIIPKFVYLFSILPNPPKQFFDCLQSKLFRFIWSNKKDRIKRKILYNEICDGGLKMILALSNYLLWHKY